MTNHDSRTDGQQRCEPAQRPLEEITGEIGHELNNLIGIIGGRVELMMLHLERGRPAEARRGADVVLGQLPRLQLIAERLRGLRRPAQERADVDVSALIRRVALDGGAGDADRPHLECGEGLPLVIADPELLTEALQAVLRLAKESPAQRRAGAFPVSFHLRAGEGEAVELEAVVSEAGEAMSRHLLSETARILAPTRATLKCDLTSDRCAITVSLPRARAVVPVLDPTGASG